MIWFIIVITHLSWEKYTDDIDKRFTRILGIDYIVVVKNFKNFTQMKFIMVLLWTFTRSSPMWLLQRGDD